MPPHLCDGCAWSLENSSSSPINTPPILHSRICSEAIFFQKAFPISSPACISPGRINYLFFSIPTACHQSPYLVWFTLRWGLASWEYAWPFHVTIWSSSVGRRSYLIKPPYRNAVNDDLFGIWDQREQSFLQRAQLTNMPSSPPPVFQEHPPKRAPGRLCPHSEISRINTVAGHPPPPPNPPPALPGMRSHFQPTWGSCQHFISVTHISLQAWANKTTVLYQEL